MYEEIGPQGYLEYAHQYFGYPGGTTIVGLSDMILTDYKNLQGKGVSSEEIVKIYVDSKIDPLGVKI